VKTRGFFYAPDPGPRRPLQPVLWSLRMKRVTLRGSPLRP